MAGDDTAAKATVSAFVTNLGLRHWLGGAGLLSVGLAGHGAGFNFSFGVKLG